MKLKKYYADNMQEALKIIKDDIGSDAVILSSKFIRSKKGFFGLFSKKRIEVVAGFEEKPKPAQESAPKFKPLIKNVEEPEAQLPRHEETVGQYTGIRPAPEVSAAGSATVLNAYGQNIGRSLNTDMDVGNVSRNAAMEVPRNIEERTAEQSEPPVAEGSGADDLGGSIGELKNLINSLSHRVENYGSSPESKFSKEVRELFNRLVDNDMERNLATELCVRAENVAMSRQADPGEVLDVFMTDILGEMKPIQCTKFKRKVVMLIGPTGVGKTTTLVKLASKFLCEDKLDVGVVNADVFRVAAKEHLKAYCDILNMEMITIYRPAEIEDALEAFSEKDIVFIDTAGKVSSNKQYQDEIGELVRYGHVDDIYLLVSASTSEKVIQSIVRNYSFLRTHNIIVTKVDETPTKGVLFNIARDSGRPLSYMTTGQSVPDDITEIDPKEIVGSILEKN